MKNFETRSLCLLVDRTVLAGWMKIRPRYIRTTEFYFLTTFDDDLTDQRHLDSLANSKQANS